MHESSLRVLVRFFKVFFTWFTAFYVIAVFLRDFAFLRDYGNEVLGIELGAHNHLSLDVLGISGMLLGGNLGGLLEVIREVLEESSKRSAVFIWNRKQHVLGRRGGLDDDALNSSVQSTYPTTITYDENVLCDCELHQYVIITNFICM